jgi:amino-acid N-acetyltransferase
MNIVPAGIADAEGVKNLLDRYAADGLTIPRAYSDIYDNIRDFYVAKVDGRVVGCCSLHITWKDLAEIRSLAVNANYRGRGVGSRLIKACLKEAKELGIKRVFALTAVPKFFEKTGFHSVRKSSLPRKVWGECIKCTRYPKCQEKPVSYNVK